MSKRKKQKFSTRIWTNGKRSHLDLYKLQNDKETLLTFWVPEGVKPITLARKYVDTLLNQQKRDKFRKGQGFMEYRVELF